MAAGLDAFEFQRWYDTGALPEREWPRREAELLDEFMTGSISLEQLEESLAQMMDM